MIEQGTAPVSSSRPSAAAPGGASVPEAAPGAAALATLSRGGKNAKAGGAKGTAAALEKTLSKGAGSFLSLLKAKAAPKGAAHDAAVSLKIPGAKPLPQNAHAPAVPGPAEAGAVGGKAAMAAEAAAKDDKPSRKKLPQTQAVTMGALAVLAPATADARKTSAPRDKSAAVAATDLKSAATGTRASAQQHQPIIHVVDLRSAARRVSPDPAPASTSQSQAADKDVSVALGGSARGTSPAPAPAVPAAPALPQAPLDRLRDAAGAELLRASNLVLKDGGGEIRLVLKPESLGSVRIRMNLVDNAIEGRIVVDSSSVKQVVDANMDALRRALTAQGFQPGSFQVSVGGQGTDADAHRREQPTPEVRRVTLQAFDNSVPRAEAMSLGDMLVNLFV